MVPAVFLPFFEVVAPGHGWGLRCLRDVCRMHTMHVTNSDKKHRKARLKK